MTKGHPSAVRAFSQHNVELGFGYRESVRCEASRLTGHW